MELRMRRWPSTTPRSYTVLVLFSLYLLLYMCLYLLLYMCLYLCLYPYTLYLCTCLWASVYLYFCLYFFSCGLPFTVLPPGLVQVCTLCIWPGAKSSYSLDSIPLLAPSGALIAIPTYYWPAPPHPTCSDHTGPQHWTFTFWATTAI